jgi:hypothetical protein
LRFGPIARLFLGEADLESVKGISAPSATYDLKVSQARDRLEFALRDQSGRSGTLTLAIPDRISIFEIDPRDASDGGQGPSLYKEWKLTSKVAATGPFAVSVGPNQFITLVVQGRGNSCTSSSDFTHWTLMVAGPRANYSLLGELVP